MTTRDIEFPTQLATSANNPSISSLARANAEGRLVLRPAFQRNLVWNEEQRSYLVDSVLKNLPIPEIYLHTTTDAGGHEELVVVDGQQRISACLSFLTDKLRLVGNDLDYRWRGRVFSEIDPDLQARFQGYRLLVRELPDLEDPVLREIFRRLNRTVEPLEPQELRHAAYTGPFIRFVEAAASEPVHSEIGVFSAQDYRRRRNDELIAEMAYAAAVGAFPNKKEGLEEAFLNYERHGFPETLESDLARRFGRALAQLGAIAPQLRRTRFRNKSDYYTLFLLLLREAEMLPLSPEGNEQLVSRLNDLTTSVAELRRLDSEAPERDPQDPEGKIIATYTRAVERAASDRLNRVRRDRALREWIGPTLAEGRPTPLKVSDSAWLEENTALEDGISDDDLEEEKAHFRDVLLTDDE